jgi:predicted regulator of Ras-like GTPase activity (Roadblock/LC7/MglB family)
MPSTSVHAAAPAPQPQEDFAIHAVRQLEIFVAENASVSYAVLTTADGFEVAAYPPKPVTQKLAAMSSSLQALSEAISREAGLANSRNLVIETDTGNIAVMAVPELQPRMSLAVVSNNSETLGRLLWAARNFCASLAKSRRG